MTRARLPNLKGQVMAVSEVGWVERSATHQGGWPTSFGGGGAMIGWVACLSGTERSEG